MYSRRWFFSFVAYCLGAMVVPARVRAAEALDPAGFKSGQIAPQGNVELSANLILEPGDLLLKRERHRITGEGHSHEVLVSKDAWGRIVRDGKVVVRSEMGGGKLAHCHWVLVKVG